MGKGCRVRACPSTHTAWLSQGLRVTGGGDHRRHSGSPTCLLLELMIYVLMFSSWIAIFVCFQRGSIWLPLSYSDSLTGKRSGRFVISPADLASVSCMCLISGRAISGGHHQGGFLQYIAEIQHGTTDRYSYANRPREGVLYGYSTSTRSR